jgi:hypothetical protein
VIVEDLSIDIVVGDTRKLIVHRVSTSYYLFDDVVIGEAWQDENGTLCGIGICEMMLFEPLYVTMYNNSSIGIDQSPLSILALRLSMSPFVRLEWQE